MVQKINSFGLLFLLLSFSPLYAEMGEEKTFFTLPPPATSLDDFKSGLDRMSAPAFDSPTPTEPVGDSFLDATLSDGASFSLSGSKPSTGTEDISLGSIFSSSSKDDSYGENYFLSDQTSSFEAPLAEDFFKTEAPLFEVTAEGIAGIEEKSSEDVLSNRGLPKVDSLTTKFDILGLPKPEGVDERQSALEQEAPQEAVVEKVAKPKGKFRDLFFKPEEFKGY